MINGFDVGEPETQIPVGCEEGRLLVKPYPITGGAFDLFSGPGDGTIVDLQARTCHRFAIQVIGDAGPPTAWEVQLLVRLTDATPWAPILTHDTASGLGAIEGGTFFPVSHMLIRVVSLTSAHGLRVAALASG